MKNTFKIGDKITVNKVEDLMMAVVTRDTTQGKVYTLIGGAGTCTTEPDEPRAVAFTDDSGATCTISYEDITLAVE